MTDATFQIGDQIKVNDTDETGQVERVQGVFVTVRFDNDKSAGLFNDTQLTLVKRPVPTLAEVPPHLSNILQIIADQQETIAAQASEIKRLKTQYEGAPYDWKPGLYEDVRVRDEGAVVINRGMEGIVSVDQPQYGRCFVQFGDGSELPFMYWELEPVEREEVEA